MHSIPSAHILLFENGKVLLVKHQEGADHITGSYGIPGGRLNENETLKQTAVREFREETGLIVEENNLFEFPNNSYTADIKRKSGKTKRYTMNVFLVKDFKGELQSSSETIPEWIEINKISNLNLLPNVANAIHAAEIAKKK